jgi:hypothetical protein
MSISVLGPSTNVLFATPGSTPQYMLSSPPPPAGVPSQYVAQPPTQWRISQQPPPPPAASNPADQKVKMDLFNFERLGTLPLNQQVAGEKQITPQLFNDITSQLNPQANSILNFARLQKDEQDRLSARGQGPRANTINAPVLNYSLEQATGNRLGIYTLLMIDILIGAIDENTVSQLQSQQAQSGRQSAQPPLLENILFGSQYGTYSQNQSGNGVLPAWVATQMS